MNKARITYRFDRQPQDLPDVDETAIEPIRQESQRQAANIIPLYQEDVGYEKKDYGDWKSPFDEETERIEKLIRSSNSGSDSRLVKETEEHKPLYYTSEEADASFERIPFYDQAAPITYRRTKKQASWIGLTSAVAGAVLTGIVLGMFVLNLFRGDTETNVPASSNTGLPDLTEELLGLGSNASSDGSSLPETDDDVADSDQLAITGNVNVALSEQTYYFVQNGVFSSRDGAELAAEQLKDKGLAGAVEINDKLTVYAGAAQSRDDALLISGRLQVEGLEVYIKPYVIPALTQIPWSEADGSQLQQYMTRGQSLVTALLAISLQHVSEVTPSPLLADQLSTLKTEHQQWTLAAGAVLKEAPESIRPVLQELNTALNSAVMAVDQYNKKPSEAYMWQVQTAVTEHLIKQKEWLSSLNLS